MTSLPQRRLGASELEVSVMSLGSWRTFERIPAEQGLAVMKAARRSGITFLDDARYDDETGTAPIPTGYSEVVFGDLFRAAGWIRDEVVVSNKLWWEHWPDEDATTELRGSLTRMGFDHVDLIYAIRPPAGLPIDVVVSEVGRLLDAGLARTWGTGMWSAEHLHEALDVCAATGVAPPVAAQMANSLVEHDSADDPEMLRALRRGPVGLVAANVLAGGALTGRYLTDRSGRGVDESAPVATEGPRLAAAVVRLAEQWAVPPAHVAFAHAFLHPDLASVLFGASTPEQLIDNVGAYDTFERLDSDQRAVVRELANKGSA